MLGRFDVYRNVYRSIYVTLVFCDITGFVGLCIVPFAAPEFPQVEPFEKLSISVGCLLALTNLYWRTCFPFRSLL